MKYADGAAFRRALEDRLRNLSLQSHVPLLRWRKLVTFDRFLARILADSPECWLLKGGLALQLRLGERARTTQDIDLLRLGQTTDLYQALARAAAIDLRDWFEFEVASASAPALPGGGTRFRVTSRLDTRAFERFHVDVGVGDPVLEPADRISTPPLLDFADLPATQVHCYPLSQQVAEKLHAYTRPRRQGESSRVKDLVDILLMAELGSLSGNRLIEALDATFTVRAIHALPTELPPPPAGWDAPYRKLSAELELGYPTLAEAFQAVGAFLNPALQAVAKGKTWQPASWEWR